jgi:hypothetical protein
MSQDRFDEIARELRPRIVTPTFGASQAVRNQILGDWQLIKSARFNAAKRLERRQNASTLAFAVAGVFGFVLPFFLLRFDSALSQHARNVVDFTAFLSGALSLTLGLVEQAKNYPSRARRFDLCGRRINDVRKRLQVSSAATDMELSPFLEEYAKALEDCDENHEEIDLELARAWHEWNARRTDAAAHKAYCRVRRRLTWQIYRLYAVVWGLPPLIGFLTWIFLRPLG